mmetsp:Transcript_4233/g.8096  ORF Transcript_4233/g.8096 Transcript_4233/m.8096 type:complete len:452 (+) Transcript_4233:146-1501(+)
MSLESSLSPSSHSLPFAQAITCIAIAFLTIIFTAATARSLTKQQKLVAAPSLVTQTAASNLCSSPSSSSHIRHNSMLSRFVRNSEKESISTQSIKCPEPHPQYFSGQYEVEVSPTSSPRNSTTFDSNYFVDRELTIVERMVPVTKTVFLIRHAESDENRRLASLSKSVKGLGRFRIPKKEDVIASMELINVPAQIDSDVSPKGRAQINALAKQIEKDDFLKKMGVQLVAHSPLKRARQTSEGMLGCVTAKPNVSVEEDCSADGKKAPSVGRVVELPILSERTPMEWLPINHDAFTQRIAEFEKWLGEQPEDVIAIVGHSQYFKSMLGLPKKFKNCDVWSLQFDYSIKMTHESVKNEINSTERAEKQKVLKQKFQDVLNKTSPFRDQEDESETESCREGIVSDRRESSEVFETDREIYEIDGVRVDHVKLPRGWRDLKRHYTYDPSMEEGIL